MPTGIFDNHGTFGNSYGYTQQQNPLLGRMHAAGISDNTKIPHLPRIDNLRNMNRTVMNFQVNAYLHKIYNNLKEPDAAPGIFFNAIAPTRQSAEIVKQATAEDKAYRYSSQFSIPYSEMPNNSLMYIYVGKCFANIRATMRLDARIFADVGKQFGCSTDENGNVAIFDPQETLFMSVRETGTLICLTTNQSRTQFRKWLGMVPRFIQDFLTDEFRTDTDFHQIMQAIALGDEETFEEYFMNYFDDGGKARLAAMKDALERYPIARLESRKSYLSNDLAQVQRNVNQYRNEYEKQMAKLTKLKEDLAMLSFLETGKVDSDVVETIMKIKEIARLEYQSQENRFFVEWCVPLDTFDEATYRKYCKSERNNGFSDSEQHRTFYEAVFIKKTHKLMTNFANYFNLNSMTLSMASSYTPTVSNTLQHPHLVRYHCPGNSETEINRALKENDLVTAFYQMLYAGHQLTLTDSTVVNHFHGQLHSMYQGGGPKLIEVETDKRIGYKQLVDPPKPKPEELIVEPPEDTIDFDIELEDLDIPL